MTILADPCSGLTATSNNVPTDHGYVIEHPEHIDDAAATFTITPAECSHLVTIQVNFPNSLPANDPNLIRFDSDTNEIHTYTEDYESDGVYEVQIKAIGESSEVLATY